MRHHIAGLWRKSEHLARLRRVASDEGVQAKKYIRKVATTLWGGVPEAQVITAGAPIAIYCWNPMGRLMYSVAEMHDQNQGKVPLHIVHLGYFQKHYVLLQRPPPPRGTSYREKHACRGGMLRERVRLDPGTRSKAAPPVRDLTDRRPPLRRRRQTGEREDAERDELAGHRPIILREPVDDRPPLERRRRPAPVLTPRRDEDAGEGQRDEHDPQTSAVEEQAQPGIAGNHVATVSGTAQSSGMSHQGAEQQTMSDEQYEILAAKRKKILQAAAERQLQAQNARQELERSTQQPTGAASSMQLQAAPGIQMKASSPAAQYPELTLYQKLVIGHSWVETRYWQDSSGSGQDLYCTLCDRWYSRHHEQGGRHLQRCASRGFKPASEEEAEQATPQQIRAIQGVGPLARLYDRPITAEEIWTAPLGRNLLMSTSQAAGTSSESLDPRAVNCAFAPVGTAGRLTQASTGSQYIESIYNLVCDTLSVSNHDCSLCCGDWGPACKGDPVYHSPCGDAGELSGSGVIPPLPRSCDVLGTRRECISTEAQTPMKKMLSWVSKGWAGRKGSEQVQDTEGVMSQLRERIFSELPGFDLVSESPIPMRTNWDKLNMLRPWDSLGIHHSYWAAILTIPAHCTLCRGGALDDDILDALDIATGRIRTLQAEALEIAKDIADIQGMVRSRKRGRRPESPEQGPSPHRPRPSRAPSQEKPPSPAGSRGADNQEMEPCRVFRIRSSDRARRSYDIGYLCDLDTVGDLHFEYARVARRGANGFCLMQEGTRLKGTWKLGRIDEKTPIMAPSYDGEALGSPLSCKRRGGSPSSIRSKIARKLSKSSNPPPACTELIQALWIVEAEALRSASGTPDQTKAVVQSLMQKHAVEFREGSWIMKQTNPSPLPRDPWAQGNDPWAKAVAVGPQRVAIKEPSEKVVAFESFVLKSQFVRESGQPLTQICRKDYVLGKEGVVLCDAPCVKALLESLGQDTQAVIVTNRPLSKDLADASEKAQIMIADAGETKVLVVWVIARGKEKISLVHPVADVLVQETSSVAINVRLDGEGGTKISRDAFARRDFIQVFFGPVAAGLKVTSRKMLVNDENWQWTIQCPRGLVTTVLSFSGKDDVQVLVGRQEEEKLNIVPIFVEGTSLSQVRENLEGISHAGITGPTRQGMFVARVTPTYLAAARQRLLGPMSVYADQWDLVVRYKYMGRFTSATNMQGIAVSLAKSWNWRVIALQTKKAGKDHQVITFGSDQDPPFWQVAMNGEVTILSKIGEKSAGVSTLFLPAEAKEAPKEKTGESEAAPSALERNARLTLEAVQSTVDKEQKEIQKRLDSQVKERVEAIEQGVKNQLKALENAQASQRTQMMQLFGDVDKKMQEDRKAVEQAHGVLKTSLENLGKNTDSKFAAIQQSLDEQAKAIQESKGGVKQQLEEFGAQLMTQIASLQPEKRRKSEGSDADMRGGMISFWV